MYQVTVNNNSFNFEIDSHRDELTVNGNLIKLDSIALNANQTSLLYQYKSYNIEVVSFNAIEKSASVKVNGNIYTVKVKDQFDQLLKQLGLDNLAANKVQQIKAPMPGLVLSVVVKPGDEIKKGESLLILEAMKMENMIKSPTDGTIKSISVKQGDKVEKNELLITFQ